LQYEVDVDGRTRNVDVDRRVGGGFAVAVGGHTWHVDAERIDDYTLSLIVGTVPRFGDTGETTDPQDPPFVRRPDLVRSGGPSDEANSPDLVRVGGRSYDVTVTPGAAGQLAVTVGATLCTVIVNGGRRRRHDDGGRAGDGPDRVVAPMPGKVVRVLVAAGDAVRARQGLAVVEAMKMENELRAGRDGIVAKVYVKEGASVDAGALLFEIR
jgi:glutaconyl-CoA/methylmalonyl-CoA decarboxylase subunit gamma